ncbi:uncharacterized protein V6R79_021033 [Siganus canaliculatus]
MSRLRSSVSALIARQPALIAQAVTFTNLTRARVLLPCVHGVPRGRYTFRTACLFIRQQVDHFLARICQALLRVKVRPSALQSLSLSLSRCKAVALMAHLCFLNAAEGVLSGGGPGFNRDVRHDKDEPDRPAEWSCRDRAALPSIPCTSLSTAVTPSFSFMTSLLLYELISSARHNAAGPYHVSSLDACVHIRVKALFEIFTSGQRKSS